MRKMKGQSADHQPRVYTAITLIGYAVIVGLTWPFALVYVAPRASLVLYLLQRLIDSTVQEPSP